MTFSDWYAANVKPQLEDSLKILPVTAREPLRTASRQAMAACWNAALDATWSASIWMVNDPPTASHLCDTLNELKVKP